MTGSTQKALAHTASILRRRVFPVAVLTLLLAFTVIGAFAQSPEGLDREGGDVSTTNDANHSTITRQPREQAAFQLTETEPARSFPVRVVHMGETTAHLVTGGTVEEVLEDAGYSLGRHDTVDLPLDREVRSGDRITLTRKEIVTTREETVLEHRTKLVPTSLLEDGQQRVLTEGRDGLRVATYEQVIVDGKEQEPRLVGEEIVEKPVTRRVLVGEIGAPVSPLDFGYEFENGEPVGYTSVLRGRRAAGYSARAGAKTASGRKAVVGHVAVNPNVIPYGTKLYIQSTDGKFVYGYAVAADTGTAIQDGVIAVDLFYGSYLESALNEIRYVDIFILGDEPPPATPERAEDALQAQSE